MSYKGLSSYPLVTLLVTRWETQSILDALSNGG